jgi:hypothetical protein
VDTEGRLYFPSLLAVPKIVVGVQKRDGIYGAAHALAQHLPFPRTLKQRTAFNQHSHHSSVIWAGWCAQISFLTCQTEVVIAIICLLVSVFDALTSWGLTDPGGTGQFLETVKESSVRVCLSYSKQPVPSPCPIPSLQ